MKKQSYKLFFKKIKVKSPFQKKYIELFLKDKDEKFYYNFEKYSKIIVRLLKKNNLDINYICDSYLKMCNDMVKEEINFRRKKNYKVKNIENIKRDVYNSEITMKYYMYGLLLSQFLWENHYSIQNFYNKILDFMDNIYSYCEIGPGHGLFLIKAMERFGNIIYDIYDISRISLNITEDLISSTDFGVKANYNQIDVTQYDLKKKYDFIVMGEVLEHIENPLKLLKKLKFNLKNKGKLFVTTCANLPAIDHIYIYENVKHIRSHFIKAGYNIVKELILPVNKEIEKNYKKLLIADISLNYAALLEKNNE